MAGSAHANAGAGGAMMVGGAAGNEAADAGAGQDRAGAAELGGNSHTGGAASGGASGGVGGAGMAGTHSMAGAAGATQSMPNNGLPPLPVPSGSSNRPRPAGTVANLTILPWADFTAALTYTFDDSQESQVHHWPDLRDMQFFATYFITSGNHGIAGYDAVWREALSLGNELGNHTAHHCNYDLTGCIAPGATLSISDEIDSCTSYMENTLGAPSVWTMAYPFGVATYAADARSRFFLGRGVGDGLIGFSDTTDPFNLPIKAAAGGETASVLSAYIDDIRLQKKWMIFLFHTLRPDPQTANTYADVPIDSIKGSVSHAKSLPDVWIGSMASVGAYWLGARLVRAAAPTMSGNTTTWRWILPAHFPPGQVVRVTVDGGSLSQASKALPWDGHGYYEVALDAGSLSWSP